MTPCRAARRALLAGPLLALAAGLLVACAGKEPAEAPALASSPPMPAGAQPAVVERVVDGDTLWVRVDEPGGPLAAGATHKIRLLEIDTPETHGGDVQCGGAEATAFAERLLAIGSTVHLVADRSDTDRYGRYLRYLWTDSGDFYNLEAVHRGVARAVLYEPNDAYIDTLRAAEETARRAGRGIWGAGC
jgi:micrococcal nuclease